MEEFSDLKSARLLSIYARLLNGRVLKKALLAQEFGVTARSIQRDLESLRSFLSNEILPQDVVYDRAAGGYRLTHARPVGLSNSEILAVCKILLESRSMRRDEMLPILDKLVDCCVPEENKRAVQQMIGNEKLHYIEPHHGQLYHNTHKNIKDQIARAYYVFSTLAKRNPKMAVFLTCYEQMRGFSLEDRLTVLFDSLTNVISRFTITDMFTKGLCVTVEDFDAKGLAPVYEKILKTIRIDYTIAKKNASKTIDQVWNFEPFYRFPFVQIEALQFAFSETTIVYQMWEGLYWDVRYTFKTDGEKFMTLFGQPFEQYVREIAKASADSSEGNVKFQDEFLYKYKGQHRASTDCYFRISNTLGCHRSKGKESTFQYIDRSQSSSY